MRSPSMPARMPALNSTNPAERKSSIASAAVAACCQRCQPERPTFARELCDSAGKLQRGAHLSACKLSVCTASNKMFASSMLLDIKHTRSSTLQHSPAACTAPSTPEAAVSGQAGPAHTAGGVWQQWRWQCDAQAQPGAQQLSSMPATSPVHLARSAAPASQGPPHSSGPASSGVDAAAEQHAVKARARIESAHAATEVSVAEALPADARPPRSPPGASAARGELPALPAPDGSKAAALPGAPPSCSSTAGPAAGEGSGAARPAAAAGAAKSVAAGHGRADAAADGPASRAEGAALAEEAARRCGPATGPGRRGQGEPAATPAHFRSRLESLLTDAGGFNRPPPPRPPALAGAEAPPSMVEVGSAHGAVLGRDTPALAGAWQLPAWLTPAPGSPLAWPASGPAGGPGPPPPRARSLPPARAATPFRSLVKEIERHLAAVRQPPTPAAGRRPDPLAAPDPGRLWWTNQLAADDAAADRLVPARAPATADAATSTSPQGLCLDPQGLAPPSAGGGGAEGPLLGDRRALEGAARRLFTGATPGAAPDQAAGTAPDQAAGAAPEGAAGAQPAAAGRAGERVSSGPAWEPAAASGASPTRGRGRGTRSSATRSAACSPDTSSSAKAARILHRRAGPARTAPRLQLAARGRGPGPGSPARPPARSPLAELQPQAPGAALPRRGIRVSSDKARAAAAEGGGEPSVGASPPRSNGPLPGAGGPWASASPGRAGRDAPARLAYLDLAASGAGGRVGARRAPADDDGGGAGGSRGAPRARAQPPPPLRPACEGTGGGARWATPEAAPRGRRWRPGSAGPWAARGAPQRWALGSHDCAPVAAATAKRKRAPPGDDVERAPGRALQRVAHAVSPPSAGQGMARGSFSVPPAHDDPCCTGTQACGRLAVQRGWHGSCGDAAQLLFQASGERLRRGGVRCRGAERRLHAPMRPQVRGTRAGRPRQPSPPCRVRRRRTGRLRARLPARQQTHSGAKRHRRPPRLAPVRAGARTPPRPRRLARAERRRRPPPLRRARSGGARRRAWPRGRSGAGPRRRPRARPPVVEHLALTLP